MTDDTVVVSVKQRMLAVEVGEGLNAEMGDACPYIRFALRALRKPLLYQHLQDEDHRHSCCTINTCEVGGKGLLVPYTARSAYTSQN